MHCWKSYYNGSTSDLDYIRNASAYRTLPCESLNVQVAPKWSLIKMGLVD